MTDNWIKEYKALTENAIDELFPFLSDLEYSVVLDASRYSLTLGGKRIRPIIMLETCRMLGGNINDALPFAVSLEMIHTYSLIHDDLPCMDDDDMRRGNPSCHIKFGEANALLAGDTLLTEAFNIASNSPITPQKTVKAISVLSKRAGMHGMIGGQVLDLSYETKKPDLISLTNMYKMKTGCLISAAAEIGAIVAGANEKQISLINEYAFNLGIAFQIIDDILDVTATADLLGKPTGSDDQNNKTTYVSILGLEKAKESALDYTNKAIDALNSLNCDAERLLYLTNLLLKRNF